MNVKAIKLNPASIRDWLRGRSGWTRKGNALVKSYRFESFRNAIVFVNRLATLADAADHHPDIDIRYDRVRVTLSTHSAGGITDQDTGMAEQIDFATSSR
jgi:4a-hydroxytetrahydrobiopterin dehydratase